MRRLLISALALMSLTACSTSPTSGRSIFTALVPQQQEASIGATEHTKIIKQFHGVNDTQEANFMVARIGARLAPYAERQDVKWTFTVLDDPVVNAFALPGGYVYITRGLLALAQDESQVAGVLAHEMGLVNARHSAQQMSQGMLAQIGLQVLGTATNSSLATQLGGTGADLYLKGHSRAHEYEADALSVRYLSKAGYDPYATAKFLQQLENSTQLEQRIAGNGTQQPTYFSTHPPTQDRVMRARALADAESKTNGAIDRAGYLNAVDGLAYGTNNQDGIVRGREFIHPTLQIRFAAPQGFVLQNTDKAVLARDANGALMVFDMATGPVDDAGTYIAGTWVADQPLQQSERITVNGLNGATAQTQVTTSQGPKEARLVALNAGGNRFYRLLFLTPPGQMNNYAQAFRQATYSFARDPGLVAAKQSRLHVVTARAGDTPHSFVGRMNVKDYPLERFCLMNDASPNTRFQTGDKVKVVE